MNKIDKRRVRGIHYMPIVVSFVYVFEAVSVDKVKNASNKQKPEKKKN